ncbi:hypothetical protein [Streptomyces sp. ML-6]|uniref:hypothetical protein n=1 Tax=Streptomyces sp. ML-6 TaxID=2982693 RepID=UPI0024C07A3E|nr:hypothetical protein [Streptomyces sp. ML-6]MDK0525093.1 hypothetical protein [Streptomyces sp. ML-6]
MPSDLFERMAACAECRELAVDYGMSLTDSRRPGADPRHWELRLTTTRIDLDDHLIAAHPAWLPDRQPGCGICESWRAHYAIGPIVELEAWHRAEHLCEPLREICVPGLNKLGFLM